jgi:RNA polymerase sigma-70 factor (ECF subfamily)
MLAPAAMNAPTTGAGDSFDARFVTTHWSVVLAASRTDTTRADQALTRLCQTYWFPLYAYARRRGFSPQDAQDLTQAFFAHLLANHGFASADPNRGRFRSFMLGCMNHFLANEWERQRAQKRGGGQGVLSLDLAQAEAQFGLEPVDNSSPDKLFDKNWALTLLQQVLNQVEAEYRVAGKATLFEGLKAALTGTRESQPYAVLARDLGMAETAVKVAVHRLRKRYRELLRLELTNTLADPTHADEELRHLLAALAT